MWRVPRPNDIPFHKYVPILSGLQCKALAVETLHDVLLSDFPHRACQKDRWSLEVSRHVCLRAHTIPWDCDKDGLAVRVGLQGVFAVCSLERGGSTSVQVKVADLLDLLAQVGQRRISRGHESR
jgi:hypothetical protein